MRDRGRGCSFTLLQNYTSPFSSNYNNPPNMDAVLACCVRSITCICCSCFLQCWQSKKQERKRSDESHYSPESFISEAGFPHARSSIAKIKGTRTQKPSPPIRQLIQQSSALVTMRPKVHSVFQCSERHTCRLCRLYMCTSEMKLEN